MDPKAGKLSLPVDLIRSFAIALVVMLHDLRGPTNTIVGEAKLLLENAETLTEDEKVSHLQTIQLVADRINTIIESVALSEQVLRLSE